MTYLALARKWRPKVFSEVMGQSHVVQALSNALDSGKVHHAFLFTGTRGVGKTTLARIFAKSLNCEQGMSSTPCGQCSVCTSVDQGSYIDLIEVDAASRTGIDDMRELIDNIQYAPTQGKFKVYLIDEVHMLSKSSFNALLKTLEEPPTHVKFLFATTDPQKLPITVLSRCLQFNLKALQPAEIAQQMSSILTAEDTQYEEQALKLLARSAAGSLRDGLSLLEQAIAQGGNSVTTENVRAMLGTVKSQHLDALLGAIVTHNATLAMEIIQEMANYAADFSLAIDQLLIELHHISLAQVTPESLEYKVSDTEKYQMLAEKISAEDLQLCYQIALVSKRDLPLAPDYRSGFEMALLRILAFKPITNAKGSEDDQFDSEQKITEKKYTQQVKKNASQTTVEAEEQSIDEVSTPINQQTDIADQEIKIPVLTSAIDELGQAKVIPKEPIDRVQPYLPKKATHNQSTKVDEPVLPRQQTTHQNTQTSTTRQPPTAPIISMDDASSMDDAKPRYKAAPNFATNAVEQENNNMITDRQTAEPASDQDNQAHFVEQVNPVAEQTINTDETQQEKISSTEQLDDDSPLIPPAPKSQWAGFIEELNLNGLVKELAMNMACDNMEAQPIQLYLDTNFQYMHNPAREASIIKEIKKLKGEHCQIEIILGKTVHETPAERNKRLLAEKMRNTKEAIKNDPNVKMMMNSLGMTIDESSIKSK